MIDNTIVEWQKRVGDSGCVACIDEIDKMNDVGIDPESGKYDTDIINTGTSKTQRDRIKTLESLIQQLMEETEGAVPVAELWLRAEEAGIDQEKAEHELSKLKAKGDAYQPHEDTVLLSH